MTTCNCDAKHTQKTPKTHRSGTHIGYLEKKCIQKYSPINIAAAAYLLFLAGEGFFFPLPLALAPVAAARGDEARARQVRLDGSLAEARGGRYAALDPPFTIAGPLNLVPAAAL
jgi:hypothetical protein